MKKKKTISDGMTDKNINILLIIKTINGISILIF